MLLFKLMHGGLGLTNIKKISAGSNGQTTYILMNTGDLWASGLNTSGEMGLGTTTQLYPNWTKIATNVDDVTAGEASALYETRIKELFWTGNSSSGECGVNTSTNVWTKQTSPTINRLIGCGRKHTFAINGSGQTVCTGLNTNGQLGIGDRLNKTTWTLHPNQTNILAGAAYDHTVAVFGDGTLWGCGRNEFNQLGLSDTGDVLTMTQLNLSNVKMLGTGENHTIALKNDGTVWVTGRNRYGQLGMGNKTNVSTWTQMPISGVRAISCGVLHTLLLKQNGELWGCGRNLYGQLGIGSNTADQVSPLYLGLNNVSFIKAAAGASYAIVGTKLKVSGLNQTGKLGIGTTTDINTWQDSLISQLK